MNVTAPAGVGATARYGILTLTGTASYGSQRAAAERAVAGLTGIRGIKDNHGKCAAILPLARMIDMAFVQVDRTGRT